MNKSVRSLFSSSSKSNSKSGKTKKKKLGDGSKGNPGSGSNQGIEGVSGGLGLNDGGSELEKLSDASGLSGSNLGSNRSKKFFNKDLSNNAIDEDQLESNNE